VNRAKIRDVAARTMLRVVKRMGDTFIFKNGAGVETAIYALVLDKTTQTFGPDTDRMTFLVPYQTGFHSNPDSGSKIILNDTDATEYAVESTKADDGTYPSSFEVFCFRWMHHSPEIDGN
jgi:hypothetical protein